MTATALTIRPTQKTRARIAMDVTCDRDALSFDTLQLRDFVDGANLPAVVVTKLVDDEIAGMVDPLAADPVAVAEVVKAVLTRLRRVRQVRRVRKAK